MHETALFHLPHVLCFILKEWRFLVCFTFTFVHLCVIGVMIITITTCYVVVIVIILAALQYVYSFLIITIEEDLLHDALQQYRLFCNVRTSLFTLMSVHFFLYTNYLSFYIIGRLGLLYK